MAVQNYPKERGLDSMYFRVERDGKWRDLCFTDLTSEEQKNVLESFDKEALIRTCLILADTVRAVGDLYNLSFAE
jgi:hypothetical protein